MNNLDKDNFSGKNHDGPHPNSPLKYLTASSIIGDEVLNLQRQHLGTIKDIMIDINGGKIEYVVIELGGFLGIGEKYFALPYQLLKVDAHNETFILDQSKEMLEKAPGFDKDHWPKTNTHMFDHATAYWGGFMGASTGAEPY